MTMWSGAHGQSGGQTRVSAAVTYVTPATIYVGIGTNAGLQTGDTLIVHHKSLPIGRVVIFAVSSNSSAAQVLSANSAIVVGDSAYISKIIIRPSLEEPVTSSTPTGRKPRGIPADNYITGRVAVQYAGSGLLVNKMDFSQPSMLLQLNVARLFGTGMVLRAYGRTFYDLSKQFNTYGSGNRLSTRVYELSLVYDDPLAPVGYSFGRVLSPYVGGFGIFDGAQFFVRTGGFTAGVAGGGLPEPLHSSLDMTHQKGIAFANFAWGEDVFTRSDVTLAYGQQRYSGKFDRDFVYTQGYIRPTEVLSLYQSAEFDVHDLENGEQVTRFHLSSGYATLTYAPLQWLNFNAGYDATRPIYLFESMKNVPDSLFSRQMQEGIRGGVTVRLPMNIMLMSNISYRPTPGQHARTILTMMRMSNIASSGLDGGLQFTSTTGVYTTGTDVAADLSEWLWQSVGITARIDHYTYTITANNQRLNTTTATLGTNVMVSNAVYLLVNYDQVWDSLRNTQRLYFECGMRF
jgi:hypothetical protein